MISLDLGGDLPLVTADHHQIQQVMLNLSVNARDAMPGGGTLGFLTTLVTGKSLLSRFPQAASGEYIGIIVQDTGMGMDANTREHLFDPFFTTKDVGKGTGLGMSVVQGIVQSHNGFIDINSKPGSGTAIELYLPVSADVSGSRTGLPAGPQIFLGGDETILFIEDEDLTRDVAFDYLTSNGYKVIMARDGREGVELFKRHKAEIDLVVSDFGLPGITGEEVHRRVTAIVPGTPVVLITGFMEPEKKTELGINGVSDILAKPFKPDDLLRALRALLDRELDARRAD